MTLLSPVLKIVVLPVIITGEALMTMQLQARKVMLSNLATAPEPNSTEVPGGPGLVGTTRRPGP